MDEGPPRRSSRCGRRSYAGADIQLQVVRGGIRRMLGEVALLRRSVGAEASVLGLGAAITTLGTAAAGATGLIAGLYWQSPDGSARQEGRKKLDDEILTREGRQPGGPNEIR